MTYPHKQLEKKKYRKHNWSEHIKKWKQSSLKQTEYCRQNNLDSSSFSKWKKSLFDQSHDTKSFVELPKPLLSNDDSLSNCCEIILPGNIRIRAGNNFNPLNLKTLIRILQEL